MTFPRIRANPGAMVLGILALVFHALALAAPTGPISAGELAARLEAGDPPPVLDVRTPAEFRAGHIPGAINVPLAELQARIGELGGLRDGELVVHCENGPRAEYADRILRARGFTDPRPLVGHMNAWRADGRPITPAGCTTC